METLRAEPGAPASTLRASLDALRASYNSPTGIARVTLPFGLLEESSSSFSHDFKKLLIFIAHLMREDTTETQPKTNSYQLLLSVFGSCERRYNYDTLSYLLSKTFTINPETVGKKKWKYLTNSGHCVIIFSIKLQLLQFGVGCLTDSGSVRILQTGFTK